MLPEAGSKLARKVPIWVKAFGEKFMCKFSSLFEAIHTFAHFHVNPSIVVCQVKKVLLFSDVIKDDGNVEAHVFILV